MKTNLMRCVRKHRLKFCTPTEEIRVKAEPELSTWLARAVSFELDAELSVSEQLELMESSKLLDEVGLLRLPYPYCYVETTLRNEIRQLPGDSMIDATLGIVVRRATDPLYTPRESGSSPLYTSSEPILFYPFMKILDNWFTIGWTFRLALGTKAVGGTPCFRREEDGVESDPALTNKMGQRAQLTVLAWLALISTRGVVVERRPLRVPNSKCKRMSVEALPPTDTHNVVKIHAARRSSTNAAASESGERKKTRLHMRRGHIRNQRYGPGRTQTRQIWINPMLVGYKEEGTVDHDYVVLGGKHA